MTLNQIILADCMDIMRELPDKAFELAIVDPPYGIGEDGESNHSRGSRALATKYTPKNYDSQPPTAAYFTELFRVSKNQIVFGANHFISRMPKDSSCWIVWDKVNGNSDFADCELAWTSFNTAVRKVAYMWNGMLQGRSISEGHIQKGDKKLNQKRIHPNEKPIILYAWLLQNYAKPGDKILDTHSGSGSLALACDQLGFDFLAIELDKDYWEASCKRLQQQRNQLKLF